MIDPAEITARLSADIAELRNAAANLYYVSWTWGQCADRADDFEALLERVRVLEAQKQAALELHSKQARFAADGWDEFSFSSVEEMQESLGDPDEDPMSYSMFEVCVHCGSVETHRQDSDDEGRSYEYSAWPCATVRALGGEETS